MSASDPGLIVVHYFRKIDVEVIGKNKTHDESVRYYSILRDILSGYGITPNFSEGHSLHGRSMSLGNGSNGRWDIKAYELEDDVVLLAKFKPPIPMQLVQQLRGGAKLNSYTVFFEDELGTVLYDHVSERQTSPKWKELVSLSPSTQFSVIFDIPVDKDDKTTDFRGFVDQCGNTRPLFPGCVLSQIGNGPVYLGRLSPLEFNANHTREFLWAIYPNVPSANSEYTHLAWTPYARNSLPHLVRFLCNTTRCKCTYDSAMVRKRRLEESQMRLMGSIVASDGSDVPEPSLLTIQQKLLHFIRSPSIERQAISVHDIGKLSEQLEVMLSSDMFNEVNQSLPELARYAETFETWYQDAIALFGRDDDRKNRLSFFSSEFATLDGYRSRIRSAIGYTRANSEVFERGLKAVDSMISSLSLRAAERRAEAEELLASRFHLFEVFVIGFYTIYLAYMLHSWSHDNLDKAFSIAKAFFVATTVLLLLVQIVSSRLASWNTFLMLIIVFFSCVFAFVLVGSIDVGWNETWNTLLNPFRSTK